MMPRDQLVTGLYAALALIALGVLAVIFRDTTGRWPWQDGDGGKS